MRLQLDARWAKRLLALPESGQGYQRVRVRLRDGRTISPAVVLNGNVLQLDDEVPEFRSAEIAEIVLE